MITSVKYVFSILTSIYYFMIFIVYIKQRCTLTIKKGIIILMTFTLFTLNILYLCVFYDLIEQRNLNKRMTAPTYCIIISSIKNTLIPINTFHLSFIFLYTYMGLSHSDFLLRNRKKICFIYLGLTWAVGISLCIPLCFDRPMIVLNTGDCSPVNNIFRYFYLPFSLISVLVFLFSMVKIYLHLRRSEEPDDDEIKVYKKKLFRLGIIIIFSILLYPVYYALPTNSIVICIRIAMQIGVSFIFVVFYSYDEEFGKTMKEVFLCKKNSTPSIDDDIYDELSSK